MKKFKIATWNMDYWRRNKDNRLQVEEAWGYVLDEPKPGIFLFQEGRYSTIILEKKGDSTTSIKGRRISSGSMKPPSNFARSFQNISDRIELGRMSI